MLITLIVAIIIFALVWTLVNYYLPIDARLIRIIDIVLVVIAILYLLSFLPAVHGRLFP